MGMQLTTFLMSLSNKLSVLKTIDNQKKKLNQCTKIHLKCSDLVGETCGFETFADNGGQAKKSMLYHLKNTHKSINLDAKTKKALITSMNTMIKTLKPHNHI